MLVFFIQLFSTFPNSVFAMKRFTSQTFARATARARALPGAATQRKVILVSGINLKKVQFRKAALFISKAKIGIQYPQGPLILAFATILVPKSYTLFIALFFHFYPTVQS